MRLRQPTIAIAAAAVVCLLPACKDGAAEEEAGGGEVATVEPVEGGDVPAITLTQEAADRIDVRTEQVGSVGKGTLTIPYAAVLYDPAGDTWTYTSPEALVYVRAPVEVERIVGDRAFLSEGPPPGTDVVVVGAAELLGTEYEVGEE